MSKATKSLAVTVLVLVGCAAGPAATAEAPIQTPTQATGREVKPWLCTWIPTYPLCK